MMTINTRIFGEVEVDENKLIYFPEGIIGFPDMKRFLLIHDSEKEKKGVIRWLQSVDENEFALPIISPLEVVEEYNPLIEDELLKNIGYTEEAELLVLSTITVPSDIKKMSVNLMAPIIINVNNRFACQIILDGDYPIKHYIYDKLNN